MHDMRLLFLAVVLIFPASIVAQQEVVNTWFCKDVVDNECKDPIADGTEIDLSALRIMNDYPALYFWGRVKSRDTSIAAIYFSREATCSVEQKKLPRDKFEFQSTRWQRAWTHLSTLSLQDLQRALGIGIASIKLRDVQLNLVQLEESPSFRVHDFRNVTCAGVLRARLFNSEGKPLPGDNNVRSVTVVVRD